MVLFSFLIWMLVFFVWVEDEGRGMPFSWKVYNWLCPHDIEYPNRWPLHPTSLLEWVLIISWFYCRMVEMTYWSETKPLIMKEVYLNYWKPLIYHSVKKENLINTSHFWATQSYAKNLWYLLYFCTENMRTTWSSKFFFILNFGFGFSTLNWLHWKIKTNTITSTYLRREYYSRNSAAGFFRNCNYCMSSGLSPFHHGLIWE